MFAIFDIFDRYEEMSKMDGVFDMIHRLQRLFRSEKQETDDDLVERKNTASSDVNEHEKQMIEEALKRQDAMEKSFEYVYRNPPFF
ncbi:hypothetical protein PRIPAC_76442 [Pristionchus pacificus]|uniref:Uncharacterized protein n=1 Tax=Pristionchus pacificus TaxID=54126 RepID=A0A2A6C738_PRIPA|nr:hypothetical protein PRIPAC_76442 [Pristionchus pacificus]|eukprot:PDM74022.1 hypothetical protein PRIPAC_41378 [Pristionchus pacificus]